MELALSFLQSPAPCSEGKLFMPVSPNAHRADHVAILVRSLAGGGEQCRMRSLAAAFASAGRRVDIYVLQDMTDIELPAGVSVHVLGSELSSGSKRLRSVRIRAYARELAEALERNPADLLLSAGSATLAEIAARTRAMQPRIPLVIRASSHPKRPIPWRRLKDRLLEPAHRARRRRGYRAADFIIAVAEDVAAGVRAMAPRVRIVVRPSPVITSDFIAAMAGPAPSHPWFAEPVPIVLSVGRLSLPKDFPTLLRAFALVRSRRELRLVILGDGRRSYRRELVELAAELGIASDVALPGWSSEVPAWLARASVFVSTSIFEGSSGAIIEALAAGCPIVATDCPGDTKALLDDGRLGDLAPIGDFRVIAALIENQLDHPRDPETLKAAAIPYRDDSAAAAYLQALDAFAAGRARDLVDAQ